MSIITGKWWVRPAKTRIKNTILSWNWGSATKTVSQVPTSAICYELWSNQCNCQSNWPTFWRIFTLLSGAPALPGGSPGVSTKYKVDDRRHLLQWSSSCSSETQHATSSQTEKCWITNEIENLIIRLETQWGVTQVWRMVPRHLEYVAVVKCNYDSCSAGQFANEANFMIELARNSPSTDYQPRRKTQYFNEGRLDWL